MQFKPTYNKPDDSTSLSEFDRKHIWHPYSAIGSDMPLYPVASADGVTLTLSDGRQLIDGMSSWWSAIHGYNVAALNAAMKNQLIDMSHVMFGGLTHAPAVRLARQLVDITPAPLQAVFFADSGSVAVEVAMKMAIQYWHGKGLPDKQRFVALTHGYHGDTFGAMSVCDPVTGMHTLFGDTIQRQFFAEQPRCRFDDDCSDEDIASLHNILEQHHGEIAALILEPVVQAAGGMWFYSPQYLQRARQLCEQFDVLLIADEIATNFGRTGRLFACEHAGVSPDIMCVGKALTGGYMTLAATLATEDISRSISDNDPGVFMHGPTFMANPLACSVASASIDLLLTSPWQRRVDDISTWLTDALAPCKAHPAVNDVRVLGATGVVEMHDAVDMRAITQHFVDDGVWIRPFGKLVYVMPPFIIERPQLIRLTDSIIRALDL